MNKNKITIIIFLLLTVIWFTTCESYAACGQRQLQKVCDSCAQQALNNSSSATSSTIAAQRLKPRYRLTASVITGRTEIYDITIININQNLRAYNFTYDVVQASRLLSTRSASGYSNYDTVVFWLPLDNGVLKTIACAGQIDASGTIEGGCGGIEQDGLLTRKYGSNFTAIPLN